MEWEIDWLLVYGVFVDGGYRIGKEIIDFRATSAHDICIYYAEFNIWEEQKIIEISSLLSNKQEAVPV